MNDIRRRMLWMLNNVRRFHYGEVNRIVQERVPLTAPRKAAAVGLLLAVLAVRAMAADGTAASRVGETDVRVLASSVRSITIAYTPSSLRVDTLSPGRNQFLRFTVADGRRLVRSHAPGEPDLQECILPLALPTGGEPTLRVIAADYEEIRGVDLLPVPLMKEQNGLLEPVSYLPDPAAYGRPGFQPAAPAELVEPAEVRSLLLGGIRIVPVQYDGVSRTARVYARLVVEVTFGGGPARSVDPTDASLLGPSLLNGPVLGSLPRLARPAAKAAITPSVLATGDWYRLSVAEEGIYRIDAAALSAMGVPLSSVDPRTIRIYGNGGREVPENINSPRAVDLVENAIYVEGESDGQFGSADFILFYGRSPRGWTYDPSRKTWNHTINRYTETNYYWLTFGGATGKRMADQPSSAAPASVVVEKFTELIAVEEEKVNKLSSGKDWYGQSMSGPSGSFTHVNALPGLVPNDVIRYRYTLVAHDETSPRFTIREGSTVIGVHALPPSSDAAYLYSTAGTFEASTSSNLSGTSSQFNVSYSSGSSTSESWIDWVEILYPRMLWGVNNVLRFRSPDGTGIAEYMLQQFTSRPMVFNVSDPANVRLISDVGGSYTFRDTLRPGQVSEYWATAVGSWRSVAAAQKMPNQNLRGYADGAEFIIVTSAEFRSAADRLKAFREKPENGGLKTIVADVADIYNEFGGGLPDITAIRDYLKYAYDNWSPRPVFVLFFGGASYDYKAILGSKSSFVPTWQSAESRHDINSYATDDFFAKFTGGNAPSLVLGRISARSLPEVNTVVDKIIRYQTQSVDDGWKMRILFIGDDSWTSDGGEYADLTLHSDDAETVASTFFTPQEVERRKIHIAEYPTAFTAQGRRKPGAASDIIDQVNQGALIVNYTGHGNPRVWAHEQIFEVNTSIPQMANANRLAVFLLATCNFSQFDDPRNYTGSELLMNKSDGGAVGVISASRKVYASGNAELNKGTYRGLFSRDVFGRVVVQRPATALFLYKAGGFNDTNDQKFFYMGDPTMHLVYPRGYAVIDSINGERMDSVAGGPRTTPVTLKALSRVTVSGTVRNAANSIDSTFNGVLQLQVNDVSRQQLIVNFYPGRNWPYTSTGGTIYRGENSITAGRFRATFIVPKDISYADTTGRGRLVAYFAGSGTDGAGFTGLVRISGTDSTAANDGEGPAMQIFLNSRGFRRGDVVTEAPTLIVDLRDSSGVNTSTAGIGHRIEAWLNNSMQSRDLTGHYTSALDNYREGTVQYPLAGLPAGRNTVRVRAWDSYNNSSMAEVDFHVASADQLTVTDVFNYPNPFAGETLFTFRQNLGEPLDVMVKVYTLAGRLIQSLEMGSAGEPMVRVPWDGRDRDGDILANGVYLYKLVVKTADGRFTSEALGKLTVLR